MPLDPGQRTGMAIVLSMTEQYRTDLTALIMALLCGEKQRKTDIGDRLSYLWNQAR